MRAKTGASGEPPLVAAADFETSKDEEGAYVWLWVVADVYDRFVKVGDSIESFLTFVKGLHGYTVFFHNLQFDGSFIADYLLRNKWTTVTDRQKTVRAKTIEALVDETKTWYSITLNFNRKARVKFQDSLKKYNMSIAAIAKAFGMDIEKGSIDHDEVRPRGYQATQEEVDYCVRDVEILMRAMREDYDNGITRMTVGSNALHDFTVGLGGETAFRDFFPILSKEQDGMVRKAYRGGWTYTNPRYQMKLLGEGMTFDVNSLYPSVMRSCPIPVGAPFPIPGPSEEALWVGEFTFSAVLKPGHLPTIQISKGRFHSPEYLSVVESETLTVTSVDWELWNEHYDISVEGFGAFYGFNSVDGGDLFGPYIDKWMKVKEESEGGARLRAKLFLNSLYGKLGLNPVKYKTDLIIDEKTNTLSVPVLDEEYVEPLYVPAAAFITAQARAKTIRAAQEHYDRFAYADTDSLHLVGTDEVSLDVHKSRLGAWKHESTWSAAVFKHAKRYMELVGDRWDVHVAGLPLDLAAGLSPEDLLNGREIYGKLQKKSVPGGVVLHPTTFTV